MDIIISPVNFTICQYTTSSRTVFWIDPVEYLIICMPKFRILVDDKIAYFWQIRRNDPSDSKLSPSALAATHIVLLLPGIAINAMHHNSSGLFSWFCSFAPINCGWHIVAFQALPPIPLQTQDIRLSLVSSIRARSFLDSLGAVYCTFPCLYITKWLVRYTYDHMQVSMILEIMVLCWCPCSFKSILVIIQMTSCLPEGTLYDNITVCNGVQHPQLHCFYSWRYLQMLFALPRFCMDSWIPQRHSQCPLIWWALYATGVGVHGETVFEWTKARWRMNMWTCWVPVSDLSWSVSCGK